MGLRRHDAGAGPSRREAPASRRSSGRYGPRRCSTRIPEAAMDPRFQGFPPHHPVMHAFLGVPIRSAGRPTGNLYLANKRGGGAFSREDLRAVELLAQHAAMAIEHARAHQRLVEEMAALRHAKEALELSEERFTRTLDDAPIGMALVDLDGRFRRVNRALVEIVGYPAEELVTLRFQDITHPDDLEVDLSHLQRLLRGEIDRYQLGKRYLHKDGSVVDVLLHASVLRDRAGAPVQFIAQIEDVTERKRIDRALREGERTCAASSITHSRRLWSWTTLAPSSTRTQRRASSSRYRAYR
ncbi:MAG: PAS domain S-box protein [Minicystis sp.]